MDPLHFCIAVAPLSVYLLLLGILNLRGRPFVTTGARDSAGLSIGVIGLMLVGPMKLFFPEAAASRFGAIVWLMLIIFYGLCVSLAVLLMRSRIVVYNISMEHLRPILTGVAMKLDKKSRWNGDSLWLPERKVHLHVEAVDWLKNIQLTGGGSQQSYEGWHLLEKELRCTTKNSHHSQHDWNSDAAALGRPGIGSSHLDAKRPTGRCPGTGRTLAKVSRFASPAAS